MSIYNNITCFIKIVKKSFTTFFSSYFLKPLSIKSLYPLTLYKIVAFLVKQIILFSIRQQNFSFFLTSHIILWSHPLFSYHFNNNQKIDQELSYCKIRSYAANKDLIQVWNKYYIPRQAQKRCLNALYPTKLLHDGVKC